MKENRYNTFFTDRYPPKNHMIRDLGISLLFREKGLSEISSSVVPEICIEQGGVQAGILATLVDVLGGGLSIRSVYPDWCATAHMSLHTIGRAESGTVVATGYVIRKGGTTVAVSVDLYQKSGNSVQQQRPIGTAIITFSRLPQKDDGIPLKLDPGSANAFHFVIDESGLKEPFLKKAGVHLLDEATGTIELSMSDYIRNSISSLQGGMFAILADLSGKYTAQTATGKPLITSGLSLHYLSPGKVGPFQTSAKIIKTTHDTALTRIELIDRGADNAIISVAMNTATLG